MNILEELQKRASAAGLTDEQIKTFINENFFAGKTAEASLDDVYTDILAEANVEKTAEATLYLEGFLKQAIDRGFSPDDAVELSKVAVVTTFGAIKKEEVKTAAENTVEKTAYFQGMFEKAASLGLNKAETEDFIQKAAGFGGLGGALQTTNRGWQHAAMQAPGAAGGGFMEALKRFAKHPATVAGGAIGGGAALLGSRDKIIQGLGINSDGGANHGILEQLKQLITQHPDIASGIGGGLAGGTAGALSGVGDGPDEQGQQQSHTLRNTLLGALMGSGAGVGASKAYNNPSMFHQTA